MASLMRPAACNARVRRAVPPRNSATRRPDRSTCATSSTVAAGTTAGKARGRGGRGPTEDSDHDESAGRTSVATQPGGP